ncbi:AraC family transcriptional regulator [Chryseobacterium sp. MMS23-Vi53]|uniref:AraC family transcriptional regulator n=1 Tax=Chryseobacterium sp. MMS23-Vi53 TaxID=3386644 RepID=UPI0039E7F820
MKKLNYFLVLFSAFSPFLFSQHQNERTFNEIRKIYEKMATDDISAMPDVRMYIAKAKKEKNYIKLIQGYRDGRQFDYHHKIQYADSVLSISLSHGTNDDVSKDYLSKGIIYYFYQKKYKLALNEYLKAYQYSKNSKDHYLHYKVLYHLGIVKGHLGYYEEALEHFNNCLAFYDARRKGDNHVNEKYNYNKGYLNSLHQLTVVNRYLMNFAKSDSLSRLGLRLTEKEDDFELEHSYFLKCMGILKFHHKNYDEAKADLKKSLPMLLKRNDFAWSTVIYYYLGKIAQAERDSKTAMVYYHKIDSVFEKHGFILPEVYNSYKYLIEYYRHKDINQQLYFTNQLLKADSIISKDYAYLSSRLHKDYDRQTLIEQKEDIEKAGNQKMRYAKIIIFSGTVVLTFFAVRYQRDQKIKKQYDLLQKRIQEGTYKISDLETQEQDEQSLRKTSLTPEMTIEIREKLEKFEKELQFTKKGITQTSIALKLGTNAHYLSIYINENKGINFTKYMAELRINYITHLLNTNTKYLNYRIEALADECGIAARQNFSKLFFEINGIRPTDYIKKRKQNLGIS